MKSKALLLENIHLQAAEQLREQGIGADTFDQALTPSKLNQKLPGYHFLGIRSRTTINPQVLQYTKELLAIGIFGIGYNHVDLKACQHSGIAVFNAPYSNTRSVVELTLGNIIALARRSFDRSTQLHQGNWQKSADQCFELRDKTLGIIGYGNIGSQLSVLAENLGMRVIYYDITEKLPLGNARKCQTMNELLQTADIITVHVDGRPENTNLISNSQFQLMKPGVLFLNLSRGFVVQVDDLVKSLRTGRLGGAAIDVYPEEPKSNGPGFHTPLQKLPNVILTPHIGAATAEAQQNIARFMADKLLDYLRTGDTTLSLNFPQLQLPKPNSFYRISHIHKNVPGVLANINSIIAKHKLNIEGQYLKTNETIGYVVTDVNKPVTTKVLQELKHIDNTVKVRLINGNNEN